MSDYRIDGISYTDGRHACVVISGGMQVYRTADYREEDDDHTPPVFRAMREAQAWVERQPQKTET
jgi:hypothetical protein